MLSMKNPRIDRSVWGPGPWDDEDDVYLWSAYGTLCGINRHIYLGHLCGYSIIPRGHPLYGATGLSHHPLNDSKECPWGGITFVNTGRLLDLDCLPSNQRIVGFDCAHCDDFCPGYPHHLISDLGGCGQVYRDFHFVKNECEKLAKLIQERRLP